MSLARDGVWKGGVWAPTVWANNVWYEQPAPTPSGGSGGGRSIWGGQPYISPVVQPPYVPPTQYARLHPFERLDEFGILRATQGLPHARAVALRAATEADMHTALQAKSIFRAARFIKTSHSDQFGRVIGIRGLPNREVLALFMHKLS